MDEEEKELCIKLWPFELADLSNIMAWLANDRAARLRGRELVPTAAIRLARASKGTSNQTVPAESLEEQELLMMGAAALDLQGTNFIRRSCDLETRAFLFSNQQSEKSNSGAFALPFSRPSHPHDCRLSAPQFSMEPNSLDRNTNYAKPNQNRESLPQMENQTQETKSLEHPLKNLLRFLDP
ncbi:hypothetical protein EJ110_NYTH50042 [Nymphaea thermarum]|nr:hypothetical protein EJ110_NYTH50042 [Nymphaea thermarum]